MSRRPDASPLGFCDHHRQRYVEKAPIPEAGEFLIGAYEDDGTIGGDDEHSAFAPEKALGWPGSHPKVEASDPPPTLAADDSR